MKRFFIWILPGIIFLVISCKKDKAEPKEVPIVFTVPPGFPKPVYNFENNTLSDAGFKAGRKLFYDAVLSKNGSISCGSCHQPFSAFANLDHPVSHGVDNCLGSRNAPTLFNLVWQKDFMWDGGVHHIEISPLNALTNSCEMANDLKTITTKLSSIPAYKALFKDAFGTEEINSQRILKALTQFMSMLVSANSKYDQVIAKKVLFTEEENNGYQIFKQKCAQCHTEPLFSDNSFRSNGLDLFPVDAGRKIITDIDSDRGKFRVPSLRNIELSRPYMHDGRFNSLEEVLTHYASGVKSHINLDPILAGADAPGIPLNSIEQKQIITFLKTLTDHEFSKDPRFAEQ